ncbi:aspartate dehydrogenase [Rhodoligotrophos defluvii]|uniref:aspartate dehydrogenase n=1 Tax=Rhodoligotrophos defluvii TaxID=2561934 RepID=UPI0010C990E9|nr:aspartate dehydrogenase [Rhodoligotrophos defluvii]
MTGLATDARARRPGRICIVGWGALARHVSQLLSQHRDVAADVVGVVVRHVTVPRSDLPKGARVVAKPSELKDLAPDLVLEIAGRSAVAPWAVAAFSIPSDFALVSTAALMDQALRSEILQLAQAAGRQLLVIPGAIGGIDGLRAAAIAGVETVEHVIAKPPVAWRGTAADDFIDLDGCDERVVVFTGNAERAAELFPQNANVAATIRLAVGDVVQIRSTLIADPKLQRNEHYVRARGVFGSLEFKIDAVPVKDNPKSSLMTALSIVRTLENRFLPVAL